MLFLRFTLDDAPYLLPASQVAEVTPLPELKPLPGAPAGIAGVVDYHGQPVPVLDLALLATGRPSAVRLSTRLILLHHTDRLLGLLAECATDTVRLDDTAFAEPGSTAAPWLGRVAPTPEGLAQRILLDHLLSPSVRASLFQTVESL